MCYALIKVLESWNPFHSSLSAVSLPSTFVSNPSSLCKISSYNSLLLQIKEKREKKKIKKRERDNRSPRIINLTTRQNYNLSKILLSQSKKNDNLSTKSKKVYRCRISHYVLNYQKAEINIYIYLHVPLFF